MANEEKVKPVKVKRHLFAKTFLPIGFLGGEIQEFKDYNKTLVGSLKTILTKDTPNREETFEQAITRLGLTKEDANQIASRYRVYALLFLLLGIMLFTYSFYLLFAHFSIIGCLLGLAATAYCLSQMFRFDFWAYQIKVQRLGVTFNEWLQHILGNTGTSR
jgi:hypothetical protein